MECLNLTIESVYSDITVTSVKVAEPLVGRAGKKRLLILSVAAIALFASYSSTYAADFLVDTPTVITNGSAANILDGNDSLIITGDGAITTVPNDTYGVEATGSFNNITNGGSIVTSGESSNGIQAVDQTIISNTGTIETHGLFSEGIEANEYTTIMNSGIIITRGDDAAAIYLRDHGMVINSGSIITYGSGGAAGIDAGDDHIIINSGLIETRGDDGVNVGADSQVTNTGVIRIYEDDGSAIQLGDNSHGFNSGDIVTFSRSARGIRSFSGTIFTNSGSIRTYGDFARAIDGRDSNTVINSGLLFTAGANAAGIDVTGGSTVTNSGKIVAAQYNSITFINGGSTLNLLAPSFIGGEIDLGAGVEINITTGPSHSNLWDFSTGTIIGGDPTIGDTVPWFYNSSTKQFATLDPSVLAAKTETLIDRTALISAVMQRRLEHSQLNMENRGRHNLEQSAGPFDKSGAWLQVMASKSKYDGDGVTLDRDIELGGFAVGYDVSHDNDTRFGMMAGYIDGRSEAASHWANSFESRSSGLFAAGYGRKNFGRMFVDLGLSAGIGTDNETKRFVNDNLTALGESHATGDLGVSFWISPEIAVGTEIGTLSNWTFAPSAKLRYAAEWFGGYTETGPSADANATVDDRMVAISEARLELAASRYVSFGNSVTALITARGGALGRSSFGEDATIILLSVTQDVSDFYEDNFAIFAGLDARFSVSDRLYLDLSTSTTQGNDITNWQGAGTLGVRF